MHNSYIFETYSLKIKDKNFIFKLWEESELTWSHHNEIHRALNLAYGNRTQSFTKKTFANCIPKFRILCYHDNQLIGHSSAFLDYVTINKEKILIGGIGLTLSLVPGYGLGVLLRRKIIELCATEGCLFAIGRVKNDIGIKKTLSPLVIDFLDIPLVGKSTRSHQWETLAIYRTSSANEAEVNELITHFKQVGFIRIENEIF